jgi:hypothetical protein
MNKTVTDLQFEIQTLQNQISDIQSLCSHREYEFVMYSWRPGASYPTRLCLFCRSPIPGITPEEEQKAADWANNTIVTVKTNE